MAQQPVEGAESGTIVEVYQSGYRIGDEVIRPARWSSRRSRHGAEDLYKVLGVDKKASAGRDQEGLPQARAPVPPGPQPRRRQGRGALQGGPGRLRRPRRRRQAQAVRPRRRLLRLRRAAPGGGRRLRRRARSSGDILSDLFGRGGGARAAARRRGRGPSAAATSRRRSRSPSSRRSTARRSRPVPTSATCTTCHGTGAKPGTSPRSARAARAAASSPRARACSRSRSRAHAAAAGDGHRGPVPDLPRRRRDPHGRSATASTSRAACATAAASGWPARASPVATAARPATCTSSRHVAESPVFKRKGDNLEVEVPLTIPEAIRGAEIEVPTLDGRKRLRVPAARSTGRPAPARRGAAQARRQGPRRHPLPLRHRRPDELTASSPRRSTSCRRS